MVLSPLDDDRLQAAIETRFVCQRSGHCCKGDGLVRFGAAEADALAAHLGLSRRQFIKQFAYKLDAATWVLRDKYARPRGLAAVVGPDQEQWCTFLEQDGQGLYFCRVNAVKPRQCRIFPHDWRNPDSLQTCAGLKILVAQLRRELESEAQ